MHRVPALVQVHLRRAAVAHRERAVPRQPLQGRLLARHPDLMYLGMQDQYYTFTMFDTQAWYARDYVLGRISLPSHEEMAADIARWRDRLAECAGPFDEIDFQTSYLADLNKY